MSQILIFVLGLIVGAGAAWLYSNVLKNFGIATAERYLQNLENQVKIKQKEDTERGVTYVKN